MRAGIYSRCNLETSRDRKEADQGTPSRSRLVRGSIIATVYPLLPPRKALAIKPGWFTIDNDRMEKVSGSYALFHSIGKAAARPGADQWSKVITRFRKP